jgi:threonyl-tRNA synthetase
MAIIGKREAEAGTVALRYRGAEKRQETVTTEELVSRLRTEIDRRALAPLTAAGQQAAD